MLNFLQIILYIGNFGQTIVLSIKLADSFMSIELIAQVSQRFVT